MVDPKGYLLRQPIQFLGFASEGLMRKAVYDNVCEKRPSLRCGVKPVRHESWTHLIYKIFIISSLYSGEKEE